MSISATKKYLHIGITRSQHEAFKKLCAGQGITMQNAVVEAILLWLESQEKED